MAYNKPVTPAPEDPKTVASNGTHAQHILLTHIILKILKKKTKKYSVCVWHRTHGSQSLLYPSTVSSRDQPQITLMPWVHTPSSLQDLMFGILYSWKSYFLTSFKYLFVMLYMLRHKSLIFFTLNQGWFQTCTYGLHIWRCALLCLDSFVFNVLNSLKKKN